MFLYAHTSGRVWLRSCPVIKIVLGIQKDSLRLVDLLLHTSSDTEITGKKAILKLLLRMLSMTGATAAPRLAVLSRIFSLCKVIFSRKSAGIESSFKVSKCLFQDK